MDKVLEDKSGGIFESQSRQQLANKTALNLTAPQCFDAVGWAAGRASGL